MMGKIVLFYAFSVAFRNLLRVSQHPLLSGSRGAFPYRSPPGSGPTFSLMPSRNPGPADSRGDDVGRPTRPTPVRDCDLTPWESKTQRYPGGAASPACYPETGGPAEPTSAPAGGFAPPGCSC